MPQVIEVYRGFEIRENAYPYSHWSKIEYCHKDYDGPEDNRFGHAESLADARLEIDDRFFDGEPLPLLTRNECWGLAALFCGVVWGLILWTFAYWN